MSAPRPIRKSWASGTVATCLAVFALFSAGLSAQQSDPLGSDGSERPEIQLGPVHVIDMATGEVQRAQFIGYTGDRIESVEAIGSAYRFDQANSGTHLLRQEVWAIPGLAEMHAHVPARGDDEQRARDVLSLYLANGITLARGMLGESWHLEVRDKLASGEWRGPRLVTSGPSFNGRTVTSPEEGVQRAERQATEGFDFLKLHPGLSDESYQALVHAAKRLGIPIAGHVPVAVGLLAALDAGQATIDHLDGYAQMLVPADSPLAGADPAFFGVNLGSAIDLAGIPKLAQATAAAGVWNVPTQSLLEHVGDANSIDQLLGRPEMRYVSNELASRWADSIRGLREQYTAEDRQGLINARRTLIKALQDAGAGLLLGSDAPQIMNVPGFSIHEELAYLVQAGLTPLQALQSGTINVARFLDESESGEIAPGYRADFVLLGRNPLQDISATREIVGVVHDGKYYNRSMLDAMLEEIASRPLQ